MEFESQERNIGAPWEVSDWGTGTMRRVFLEDDS